MEPNVLQYLLDKACVMGKPVSGTFELTGRCNLSCRMCYIHQASADPAVAQRELPTQTWLDLIAQAQKCGTLTMLLTGGEPLLRPDFAEIYTACRRAGFLVSVNTNGSLLTERHFSLFQQIRPFLLNISLYGADDETYERICGQKGIYSRVRENILRLRQLDLPVKINYTVTKENFHQRDEIFAFAREHGCLIQETSYLFPPVRSCTGCNGYQRVDPQTAGQMQFACEQARYPASELRERIQKRAASQYPSYPGEECGIHCRAGKSAWWITYDGTLQICGMMPAPSADLKKLPFSDAWAAVTAQRQDVLLPQACAHCRDRTWCEVCAAICSAEACGAEPPAYLCQKTATYRAAAERWLEAHP